MSDIRRQRARFATSSTSTRRLLFGGYYFAAKDPAGVAPRSGPMEGIRYELVIGGPAQFVFRLARVNSERHVDRSARAARNARPRRRRAGRSTSTDLGFSLNLTGQRSWHGVVPVIYTGVGLASDLDKQDENDPFNLGTTFAFSLAGWSAIRARGTVSDAERTRGRGFIRSSTRRRITRRRPTTQRCSARRPDEKFLEEKPWPDARGIVPPLPLNRRVSRHSAQ